MTLPDAVLLLAHGTVADNSEMSEFLTTIRRGHPPSPALLSEMIRRYDAIGGSPLLKITSEQAAALSSRLGRPCLVAMRLWAPRVDAVLPLLPEAVRRVCLLPLAPFSVPVYDSAARAAAAKFGADSGRTFEFVGVPPWGEDPGFVAASAALIRRHLPAAAGTPKHALVLTAHSLPLVAIRSGDLYADQVSACAQLIGQELNLPVTLAYQSQGDGGGEWLGPDLGAVLSELKRRDTTHVTVAPFGFLSDHVETLYDLDIEAKSVASSLGLDYTRVPALNTDPALIEAMAQLVLRAQ